MICVFFLIIAPFHANGAENVFEAHVIKILEERDVLSPQGKIFHQQNLAMKGVDGLEFDIIGIGDIFVVKNDAYEEGDRVLVSFSEGENGEKVYYIEAYVRTFPLTLLLILFVLCVVFIGKTKGLKALGILALTGLILVFVIVPAIKEGYNPLLISAIGAFCILCLAIFGTEGFGKKSLVSLSTLFFSLFLIVFLSYFFSKFSKLSGVVGDEALFITNIAGGNINLFGLMLAGMIIGALGVLDDVVISQVSLVEELVSANPSLNAKDVYERAMHVGIDHINAIVNTLFLAYAGVSLPLLILFSLQEAPFLTFSQVISHEIVAIEIVRTLVGSMVLVLTVPIATRLAAFAYAKSRD